MKDKIIEDLTNGDISKHLDKYISMVKSNDSFFNSYIERKDSGKLPFCFKKSPTNCSTETIMEGFAYMYLELLEQEKDNPNSVIFKDLINE